MFLVFFVTLAAFPAVLSGIKSKDKDDGSAWTGMACSSCEIKMLSTTVYKASFYACRQPSLFCSIAGKFFTPVVCFLVFNVGDFSGRFLAGMVQKVGWYRFY